MNEVHLTYYPLSRIATDSLMEAVLQAQNDLYKHFNQRLTHMSLTKVDYDLLEREAMAHMENTGFVMNPCPNARPFTYTLFGILISIARSI